MRPVVLDSSRHFLVITVPSVRGWIAYPATSIWLVLDQFEYRAPHVQIHRLKYGLLFAD